MVRYGIGLYFSSMETDFPIGTFIANFLACLILGVLVGMQLKNNLQSNYSLLLITGFCGGFSTFSTFSNESFRLFENQQYGLGMLYIGGSVIIGLIAIYLGIKMYSTL
jgi:CrcB protein